MKIEFIQEATSTNDIVRTLGRCNTIIVAESQTAGRGQRGNSWESAPKQNLTFSLMITPLCLEAEKQFYISKVASLAVVATLNTLKIEAQIKWPNDIYVGDKKIAGILIENDLTSRGIIGNSIIGIGLNVNQTKFVSDAPNPISIASILNTQVDRTLVIEEFAHQFSRFYTQLVEHHLDAIDINYLSLLYRLGVPAEYTDKEGTFTGIITSVAPTGELTIKNIETNLSKQYLFKEVAFVI